MVEVGQTEGMGRKGTGPGIKIFEGRSTNVLVTPEILHVELPTLIVLLAGSRPSPTVLAGGRDAQRDVKAKRPRPGTWMARGRFACAQPWSGAASQWAKATLS